MCRIASILLLQRLNGSKSGDARNFNNIETRAIIKFFFMESKTPKEIHAILTGKLGEHVTLYVTFKYWMIQFIRGNFFTSGAPCPGRPKTVTTSESIDQIHELILEDPQQYFG
jgi:hypothetical protein